MTKQSKSVMLTLRIPTELREALRGAAKANHQSINSLVISRLWQVVQPKAKAKAVK